MRTAMIVDDSRDIRALLTQAFEMEGYQVLEAENGALAQQELAKNSIQPCIILLDLMMPVMDGRQFLSWKNQTPEVSDIPVVVISAGPSSEILSGTKAFLKKPVDLKSMFQLIEDCCCGKL